MVQSFALMEGRTWVSLKKHYLCIELIQKDMNLRDIKKDTKDLLSLASDISDLDPTVFFYS